MRKFSEKLKTCAVQTLIQVRCRAARSFLATVPSNEKQKTVARITWPSGTKRAGALAMTALIIVQTHAGDKLLDE
jgi:hypothetical protein